MFTPAPWYAAALLVASTTPVTRLKPDASPSDFDAFARAGIPAVLPAATNNWPMEAWSCTKIAAEFSDVKMRIEYADAAAAAAAAGHQGDSAVDTPDGPDDLQRLGNLSWIDVKAPNGMPPGSAGPEFAPWYWDIKDGDPRVLARIQNLTQLPAVLRADSTNIHEVLWSPEIWFSPPRGGAKAHADEHCEATVSIQLSGTKRWRLSPFPTVTASNFSMQPSLADGVPLLVSPGWTPTHTVNLEAGEALFFPPGTIHETTNVGPDCAASITYQYIRNHLETISVLDEMRECWPKWASLATLLPRQRFHEVTDLIPTELEAEVRAVPDAVNADSDGIISEFELLAWAKAQRSADDRRKFMANRATMSKGPAITAELEQQIITDWVSYHDIDNNGMITVAELRTNVERWLSADAKGRPAREVSRKHREYSDSVSTCPFVDMVPTWAGAPAQAPYPPPPPCRDHVHYYRGLLAAAANSPHLIDEL